MAYDSYGLNLNHYTENSHRWHAVSSCIFPSVFRNRRSIYSIWKPSRRNQTFELYVYKKKHLQSNLVVCLVSVIYFPALFDRFSKYTTVEVFDKPNGPHVIKFLDEYKQKHGVPRNIRLETFVKLDMKKRIFVNNIILTLSLLLLTTIELLD